MTLSRPPRRTRTRNVLGLALLLSVLLHVVGGGLWALLTRTLARIVQPPPFLASLQEPPAPKADIIRLERRAKAAARPAHENRVVEVAPQPRPVPTVAPALPKQRHEIAHVRVHAHAQPPAFHGKVRALPTPDRPKTVAYEPAPNRKPALSDRQLTQLGHDFAKTIADSRETLGDVQTQTERATVTTIKKYAMHVNGFHEGMQPGDGTIEPISHQRIGNTMWYYARYTYIHSDGTYEADEIPWPIHYPIDDDPFARHDKRIPLQPPPEGFKPNRPLKPILAQYFGGPAVTD